MMSRKTKKERKTAEKEKTKNQISMSPQTAAFQRYLNRVTVLVFLVGILFCEFAMWFGTYLLEINLSGETIYSKILDFLVTFEIFPTLALYCVYITVVYAILKLGAKRAKFQMILFVIYTFLQTFLYRIQQNFAVAAKNGIQMNGYLLGQTIWYELGNYVLYLTFLSALITPVLIIAMAILLQKEYQRAKTEKQKVKNPVPRACLYIALLSVLFRVANQLPESIRDYMELGFFQNANEAVYFFSTYFWILAFGVAGYFIMRGMAKVYLKKIRQIKKEMQSSSTIQPKTNDASGDFVSEEE